MSEKKHIDRLFQEKFKDFEVAPKEQVWKNIEKELKKKQRKPLLLPLWYKIAGVAAVLAVIFLAGNLLFNNAKEHNVVHSEETEIHGPIETEFDNKTNALVNEKSKTNETQNTESPGLNESFEEENTVTSKTSKETNIAHQENGTKSEKTIKTNSSEIFQNGKEDKIATNVEVETEEKENSGIKSPLTNSTETATVFAGNAHNYLDKNPASDKIEPKADFSQTANHQVNNSIEIQERIVLNNTSNANGTDEKIDGTVAETKLFLNEKESLVVVATTKKLQETNTNENAEEETSKWQISPFAAPIYYDGFGGKKLLDPALAQNENESEITMAYGVNLSYQLSERLKIRSGVSQVSMVYHINNIAFVSTIEPVALRNVSYNTAAADLKIIDAANIVPTSGLVPGNNPFTSGTLNQQLGFIEVPLEVEYALIDKKFALSIIGGASTLFLNENNIAIKSAEGTTNIGETSNLNEVSFSTNIGLGLSYKITKQFEFSLEPMFKYQLNTYSESINDFNPYYLGVYTGFSFKF